MKVLRINSAFLRWTKIILAESSGKMNINVIDCKLTVVCNRRHPKTR